MDIGKEVGRSLTRILKEKEITRAELARRSTVDPVTIHHIITGKHNPSLPTLQMLAKALGVSMAKLLSGDNVPDIETIDTLAVVPIINFEQIREGKAVISPKSIIGHTLLWGEEVKSGVKMFAVHIKGRSMDGLGICDSDIGIFKVQRVADPGSVILAVVDGEPVIRKQGLSRLQTYR